MKKSPVNLDIENSLWSDSIINIAGVDEAGRGPLAGPVVAAAVILPQKLFIENVNDSKKLSESQRELLFDKIYEQAISVAVGIVDNKIIDQINILQATTLAMNQAIDGLKIKPDFVIVDGNSFKNPSLAFRNIIGGDAKSLTIASASIIAKVTRDRIMKDYAKMYPQYGFDKHKGYGTKSHIEAIRKYGYCEIHRKSFKIIL